MLNSDSVRLNCIPNKRFDGVFNFKSSKINFKSFFPWIYRFSNYCEMSFISGDSAGYQISALKSQQLLSAQRKDVSNTPVIAISIFRNFGEFILFSVKFTFGHSHTGCIWNTENIHHILTRRYKAYQWNLSIVRFRSEHVFSNNSHVS